MSEASTVEAWQVLGAIPERPLYIAAGSASVSNSTIIYTQEATPAITSSNSPSISADSFGSPRLGFESASVAKASPGMLYEIIGTCASGSAHFLQIFDKATTPAPGAIPQMSFYVAASSTISISPRIGHFLSAGITWGWSTRYDYFTGAYAGAAIVYYK